MFNDSIFSYKVYIFFDRRHKSCKSTIRITPIYVTFFLCFSMIFYLYLISIFFFRWVLVVVKKTEAKWMKSDKYSDYLYKVRNTIQCNVKWVWCRGQEGRKGKWETLPSLLLWGFLLYFLCCFLIFLLSLLPSFLLSILPSFLCPSSFH